MDDFMSIRKLIAGGLISSILAVVPVTVDTVSLLPQVTEQTASAKNGNDRGNSGNNNSRNDNGRSDNGRDSRGNDSKGNGKKNDNKTPSKTEPASKPPSRTDAARETIEVRHTNGITEALRAGRYVMKDAKGRTIVNRRATPADIRRLERYAPH